MRVRPVAFCTPRRPRQVSGGRDLERSAGATLPGGFLISSHDRGCCTRNAALKWVQEAGLTEVPPLEEKLNVLATIAQIAPLMGLLGTTLGMVKVFGVIQVENLFANRELLIGGIWQSLVCTSAGLALAIPCYAAYNYLVSRVNSIVLEMERAATEIINVVTNSGRPEA